MASQTKVVETIVVKATTKAADLAAKIGKPLGSPINGREVGKPFNVILTGNIEIRDFNGVKGAYFTTKEGYSIKVNAGFDAEKHKANSEHKAVCRELPVERDGKEAIIKYCAFYEN